MKIQEILSYAVSDERLKPATHFSKHTQVVIEPNHDLLKFNDQYPLYREVGLDDDCLETDFWRYGDLVSEDACVSYTSTKTTENLECPQDLTYKENYLRDFITSSHNPDVPFLERVGYLRLKIKLSEILKYFLEKAKT